MRLWTVIAIAVLMMLSSHLAAADVRVTFVNSYYYSDFKDQPPATREAALDEIRKTLQELGARYLGSGEVLKIEVLDIERGHVSVQTVPASGRGRAAGNNVMPSQMDVEYVLQQRGRTILHDRETLSDVDYLVDPTAAVSKDSLVYEKAMLRDWFAARFGAAKWPAN